MVLPGMGHLSKPTSLSHRTRHTIWQVGHSCHMPRCLGICVRQSKPWEVIYVCLKRGNLELFVFNAIDSNEDVNRKLPLLLIQSSSILTNKSLTMCPPLKLKSLPMTDRSFPLAFLLSKFIFWKGADKLIHTKVYMVHKTYFLFKDTSVNLSQRNGALIVRG